MAEGLGGIGGLRAGRGHADAVDMLCEQQRGGGEQGGKGEEELFFVHGGFRCKGVQGRTDGMEEYYRKGQRGAGEKMRAAAADFC